MADLLTSAVAAVLLLGSLWAALREAGTSPLPVRPDDGECWCSPDLSGVAWPCEPRPGGGVELW